MNAWNAPIQIERRDAPHLTVGNGGLAWGACIAGPSSTVMAWAVLRRPANAGLGRGTASLEDAVVPAMQVSAFFLGALLVSVLIMVRVVPRIRVLLAGKRWRQSMNAALNHALERRGETDSAVGLATAARFAGLLAGSGPSFDVQFYNRHYETNSRASNSRLVLILAKRGTQAREDQRELLQQIELVSAQTPSFEIESISRWSDREVMRLAWFLVIVLSVCMVLAVPLLPRAPSILPIMLPFVSMIALGTAPFFRCIAGRVLDFGDVLCRPHEVEFASPLRQITFDANTDFAVVERLGRLLSLVVFIKPDGRSRSVLVDMSGLAHLVACWRPREVST